MRKHVDIPFCYNSTVLNFNQLLFNFLINKKNDVRQLLLEIGNDKIYTTMSIFRNLDYWDLTHPGMSYK